MNRRQRNVIWLAVLATLLAWTFPPVERTRRVTNAEFPPNPFGPPSYRLETGTESQRLWTLGPDDRISVRMLIARTIFVWTVAAIALEICRRAPATSRL